jgi:hypothetical protein
MRVYEGSPRQDWEEVLRCVGTFADREHLKEILFLELEGGFLMQGLALPAGSMDADTYGTLAKRTYELAEEQISQLMDEGEARRGTASSDRPAPGMANYYELSMRIVGKYIDEQRAHDVFFFEQDGSYVVRLFGTTGSHGAGQKLAEFTRDEILAMIEAGPDQRVQSAPEAGAGQQGG